MWENSKTVILTALVIGVLFVEKGRAYQVGNNPNRRAEVLDPDGKFLLEWEVLKTERILFNVTVRTKNWVGFGLSRNGLASGADIVIGGVHRDGRSYFSDRHISAGGDVPLLDKEQDWTLHSAWGSGTHTFLSFSRELHSCDPEDYSISTDRVSLIWAYGRNEDDNGRNYQKRGEYSTYLLDPEYAPQIFRDKRGNPRIVTGNSNKHISKDVAAWSVQRSLELPTNESSYICAIHKAPKLGKKHHVIGHEAFFPDETSRLHTKLMMVYRCHAPASSDVTQNEMFESHLSNPGEPCYLQFRSFPEKGRTLPLEFCSEFYFSWGPGGKTVFMPNHVGYPFGENEDEYFLVQLGYYNPERKAGLNVDVRMDFFYTSQLRPHDGASFGVGHQIPSLPESLLLPPHSRAHSIYGHCSQDCTARMFPESGITVTSVLLHSHDAGGAVMRLRHFRGGRELPWVQFDNNYMNNFQITRHLPKEIKILPGDQLTMECQYSTNDSTVVGGFSRRQEMCLAVLVYYDKIQDYGWCESGLNSELIRNTFLGVQNVSWVEDELEWIVDSPAKLAGYTISEVSDNFVNWTPSRRKSLQHYHKALPQWGGCYKDLYSRTNLQDLQWPPPAVPFPGPLDTPTDFVGLVSYPILSVPYVPPARYCPYTV